MGSSRRGTRSLGPRSRGCGVLKLARLARAPPASGITTSLDGVAEDATIAASTGAPLEVAAALGFGHSWLGLDDLPFGASGSAVGRGVAFGVDVSLRAAGCHLAARHHGERGVGGLWGQREAHLHVEAVGPELQLLRPLPANGRSRGEKGVVSIVFGVGSHHLDALGLAELCGELGHERLAQSRRAVKTEAESLGVLDHAREEVVGEATDAFLLAITLATLGEPFAIFPPLRL